MPRNRGTAQRPKCGTGTSSNVPAQREISSTKISKPSRPNSRLAGKPAALLEGWTFRLPGCEHSMLCPLPPCIPAGLQELAMRARARARELYEAVDRQASSGLGIWAPAYFHLAEESDYASREADRAMSALLGACEHLRCEKCGGHLDNDWGFGCECYIPCSVCDRAHRKVFYLGGKALNCPWYESDCSCVEDCERELAAAQETHDFVCQLSYARSVAPLAAKLQAARERVSEREHQAAP